MKTNIIRILLIIVFTILFVHLFSQNYTTTHFNEKNGFNASTVYGINQDSKGFLWIGTDVGLIRYDGNEFKQYGLKDGLVDLEVINTSIDSRDNLILYNFSNQINYYQNGKFKNSKSLHKLSENDVNGHQIGAYNNLEDSFILSMYGSNCFYILKISIDSVETHKKIELAKNRKIISVTVFDDNYFVFFSENKNIKYVEIKDEKIIRKGFFKNQVGVFASNDNHIYSIYGKTLKLFKKNSDSLLELSQEIDLIHKSKHIFSNKNLIWVLLKKGGVLKIDAQGNKEFFNEEEIVNYGFQDRDSNFWIGTEGNGLYFYKKNQIQNFGIETLKPLMLLVFSLTFNRTTFGIETRMNNHL